MLDTKLALIRTDFDAKLTAQSNSVDDRIQDALKINSTNAKQHELSSTIDSVALITDLRCQSLERAQHL